jgi:hypothetical protein
MKNNPIYKSGQPLVSQRSATWRIIALVATIITVALVGGFLGTGIAQADVETEPVAGEGVFVTPGAADNARDLTDEVRTTVLCPEEASSDDGVCEERAASEDVQVPVTGD